MAKAFLRRPGDKHYITFSINGEKHTVYDAYPVTTSLNDYIRDVAGLKGTKVMCKEAGCGCCAVTVSYVPEGDKVETMSINSCLCPLYTVDGWQITTTEGIGSQFNGLHPIQDRLAKYNATQCGYCTPGFVMSVYGLLHQDPKATQQEIEDSLDGHICRCTGYRSILDAMKSFASDCTSGDAKTLDIEDLNKHLCLKTGEVCKGKDFGSGCHPPTSLNLDLRESQWYRPLSLKELGTLLVQNKDKSTKMLFGNTAAGIFKNDGIHDIYIDLHGVQELYQYKESADSVTFGGNTTLTRLKDRLKVLQHRPGFSYCTRVIRHLKVLGSVLVRNAGSIAGNFMIKHSHHDFPSDLFTMMEAIGVRVGVYDPSTDGMTCHNLLDFLYQVDMTGKVLVSLEMPTFDKSDNFRSFKITPRWQNAHAYINAAFRIRLENRTVTVRPALIVGGINGETVHVSKAEEFVTGKRLSESVVKETLKIMSAELKPSTGDPVLASGKYRHDLAVNLLYKTLLELVQTADNRIKCGAESMGRPLSSGLQTFQEKEAEFPVKQALSKVEAPVQATGEAVFANDLPAFQHELFAAFVLSTVAAGNIDKVDTTEALSIPGVVRYISASDIPEGGQNSFMTSPYFAKMETEEVFATKEVEYAGQAIGLILAETQSIAEEAAQKVRVTYNNVKEPVVYLQDALDKGSIYEQGQDEKIIGNPEEALKAAEVTVSGEIKQGTQYYYYIEDQISVAVPSEDGIDLYAATQWADLNQTAAAKLLGKPHNFINMIGPRVGGGFGGKTFYSSNISAAAALACYVTNRPVRACVNMSTNMKMTGKRFPMLAKYTAGFGRDGKMKVIDVHLYIDSGFRTTCMAVHFLHQLSLGYYVPHWRIKSTLLKTNKATNQTMRAPGAVPAALVIESILEHAAKEIDMHPIVLKEKNLYENGLPNFAGVPTTNCTLRDIWQRLKQLAHVDDRMKEVNNFNQSNQWRKRGLTMSSVKYGIFYAPPGHTVNISVFAEDGTVSVMTTGCEMGQGLFTKVAQTVARTLKIPLHYVKVRSGQNNVNPNPLFSGASSATDMCVAAALNASNELNERMRPIREKMPDADWPGLLKACHFNNINLAARANSDKPDNPNRYYTYCVGAVETEVDVLTGEYQVRRVDIMCDFGHSINPTIDIGQVEGSFVMGLGAYLTENVIYDRKSGHVLNDGTWEYKPPTTKDIPIDWRIHFLPDSPNPVGVLSSKAVGEPTVCLAVAALLAIKSGVESVREELTGKKEFLTVDAPYTVEKVQLDTKISLNDLGLVSTTVPTAQ